MWEFTPEAMTAWGTLLTGIGAVGLLLVWKIQLAGKDEYQLAKKIQLALFEAWDLILRVRHEKAVKEGDFNVRETMSDFRKKDIELSVLLKEGLIHWGSPFQDLAREWLAVVNDFYAGRIESEITDDYSDSYSMRVEVTATNICKFCKPYVKGNTILRGIWNGMMRWFADVSWLFWKIIESGRPPR